MEFEGSRRCPLWRRLWVRIVAVVAVVVGAALLIAAEYLAHHMQPLLQRAVINTLQQRFHERAELDSLQVSVVRGLQVQGRGLRLLPVPDETTGKSQAVVKIDAFTFHVSVQDLRHLQARVDTIYVRGLEVHIPPHSMHGAMQGRVADTSAPQQAPQQQAGLHLTVGQVVVQDALLVIETDRPGKLPLQFRIAKAVVTVVGSGRPSVYEADLTNPKPTGRIHAFGNFGPWNSQSPRETPISGDYNFAHADLSTIKGIRGTLESTGHFAGELDNIVVDGTTYTPDFALAGREHTMLLQTKFHAIVDGTTGDTTLAPVQATLGSSAFTATGSVTRVAMPVAGPGSALSPAHDVALAVTMPHGRIEDLLRLAVNSDEPVMYGAMTMQAKLHVPPGKVSVADKLHMEGTVRIADVQFTSKPLQDKVDGLSLRAQGRPRDAKAAARDGVQQVVSELTTQFVMGGGMLKAESLQYTVPGAQVQMVGVYVLDSRTFSFSGHVHTDAKASQMVTGWKSQLLRPFDNVLAKDGAGMVLPISIDGVHGDYTIGLRESRLTADEIADQMSRGRAAQR